MKLNLQLLAHHLKVKRDQDHISLAELGQRINVSAATLSRIENCQANQLSLETFLSVCNWLQMTPDTFIVGRPVTSPLQTIQRDLLACPDEPALCHALAEVVGAIMEKINGKR